MRALLRRQLWRPLFRPSLLRRLQHDLPHKEYFQNPGQAPIPDPSYYANPAGSSFSSDPSYFSRASRSVFWATVFSILGVAAGTGAITWEYLQPGFDPDSEEEYELEDEILDLMDLHPLVEELLEGGWREVQVYLEPTREEVARGEVGMLQLALGGSQGVTLRQFILPDSGYSIFVFYLGSGLEGWPDTIHGGMISTLFVEAFERHCNALYATDTRPLGFQGGDLNIDFKKRVRPGEIYSILMVPAAKEVVTRKGDAMMPGIHDGDIATRLEMIGLFMQMEHAPEIHTEVDEVAKTENHTVTIPSRAGKDKIFAQAKSITYVFEYSQEELEQFVKSGQARASES